MYAADGSVDDPSMHDDRGGDWAAAAAAASKQGEEGEGRRHFSAQDVIDASICSRLGDVYVMDSRSAHGGGANSKHTSILPVPACDFFLQLACAFSE